MAVWMSKGYFKMERDNCTKRVVSGAGLNKTGAVGLSGLLNPLFS